MAWERVGNGDLDGGDRYVIERHVIHLPVPYTHPLPTPLDSYRWRLVKRDGTATVQATGRPRDETEASIQAFRAGTSPV